MIHELITLLNSEIKEPLSTWVAITVINAVFLVCSGIVCSWGFQYLANLISVTPPGIWESVGIVFVLNHLIRFVSSVRLWGS